VTLMQGLYTSTAIKDWPLPPINNEKKLCK
jgi:hypothetical protein